MGVVGGSANHMFVLLHKIFRAAYLERTAVERLRIEHGVLHVLVTQKLLNGEDVLAPLRP
jgi:hypothetical protein